MKTALTVTPWIIILILLAYINQCTAPGKTEPKIVCKEKIKIHDSISPPIYITGKTVYTPMPYELIVYDTLTQDTITNEHLSYLDYMAIKKYTLPINDTNQTLSINLDIQYNSIRKWNYTGEYFQRYKIKEITKYEVCQQKNEIYIGAMITANKNKYLGITPALAFMTKKKTVFMAGYDIFNNNISAGLLIKLGK